MFDNIGMYWASSCGGLQPLAIVEAMEADSGLD
jgi:hypothetical protein